mmetsp:Transcript_33519/g.88015  ORF Transcript_33519/g.88015 Transcript_33519/m.88015 type:complete len:202 (-) Transcript_33519:1277-1882(-)
MTDPVFAFKTRAFENSVGLFLHVFNKFVDTAIRCIHFLPHLCLPPIAVPKLVPFASGQWLIGRPRLRPPWTAFATAFTEVRVNCLPKLLFITFRSNHHSVGVIERFHFFRNLTPNTIHLLECQGESESQSDFIGVFQFHSLFTVACHVPPTVFHWQVPSRCRVFWNGVRPLCEISDNLLHVFLIQPKNLVNRERFQTKFIR